MNIQAEVVRIFLLAVSAFVVAMLAAPLMQRALKHWKIQKNLRTASSAPVFHALHAKKAGTPTMGGVLVWGVVYAIALAMFFAARSGVPVLERMNFLSRSETFLPFASLLLAAFVGLVDDLFNVFRFGSAGGGLRARHRLLIYSAIAASGAWWFYAKLGWDLLHVPFFGDVNIGLWYVPVFMLVLIATSFSVNEADGLDGLAGGTLLAAFGALGVIAFFEAKTDLAAFCAVIAGALSAFLWFNVPPAKFYMGDTGSMSLGVTLGVVAMLTNTALLLPLIGFVFVIESASVLVQIFFKRVLHRKFFLSAPLHHHLEAMGWSEARVVMRLWIIAGVVAIFGVILAIIEPTSHLQLMF